jgi:hydroxypyruvate isomerase
MPRFAANLSMMFTEAPFLDRFAAARRAGFDAVEFLFPYAFPAAEIAARLTEHGLTQALFNLPPGDWENGERGVASLAGREAEFDRSVEAALSYAEALNCRTLHVMAGIPPAGERERAFERYCASLKRAAPLAASAGVTLVLEPINARDMPGYLVSRTADARRAIELAAEPNLGLQLDLYHRQIMDGDLAHAIRDNADITRHVQIAGPPERHEPDGGEVAFPYLFEVLDGTGYEGFVGCEYRPRGRTEDGLAWFEPWRR